jgi:hypothetical protein
LQSRCLRISYVDQHWADGFVLQPPRTLVLATLRGAVLDLLAAGDAERITRAVQRALGDPGTAD